METTHRRPSYGIDEEGYKERTQVNYCNRKSVEGETRMQKIDIECTNDAPTFKVGPNFEGEGIFQNCNSRSM